MRISDWSSDVCSSDLHPPRGVALDQRDAAIDPPRATGGHDDRIGGARGIERRGQRDHEHRETERPGKDEHTDRADDHSRFPNATSTATRAAPSASSAKANGSAASTIQSPAPSATPPRSTDPTPPRARKSGA